MAKKTIPKEQWIQTPVVLKATAGLRLLPQEKAKALLDEVRLSLFLRQFGRETNHPKGMQTTLCARQRERKTGNVREKRNQYCAKAAVLRLSGVEGTQMPFELSYSTPPHQPHLWFLACPVSDNFAQD